MLAEETRERFLRQDPVEGGLAATAFGQAS